MYLTSIPFQLNIIFVMLRYVFRAREVNIDVLFAAVSVYLLLSAVYVPIYGMLEIRNPGSIVDTVSGQSASWHDLVYFSQITLTTTAYGDILPISHWARSFAASEALLGVLYLAILISRLVSLYAQQEPRSGEG